MRVWLHTQVDVWSVGVIFFQMLYGRRPYGEGLSQEQIMRDRVMLGAKEVRWARREGRVWGGGGAAEVPGQCTAGREFKCFVAAGPA